MKVIITFTFCCDNLLKSILCGSGKAWKTRGTFFSYFVVTHGRWKAQWTWKSLSVAFTHFMKPSVITACCLKLELCLHAIITGMSNTPGNPGNLLEICKISWKFSG